MDDKFWLSCVSHLREKFDPNIFDAFISPARVERGENGEVRVFAPDRSSARWLKNNISETISQLAAGHFDEQPDISFHTARTETPENSPTDAPATPRPASAAASDLRPDFTLANFVCGRANELALAAARNIGDGDARLDSSLLFLYGGAGMGKTHLAQAIGNRYLHLHPDRRVRYVTARDFMHEVIHACRTDRHGQFKNRYGSLDMLIVDDIQYIGGDNKERTQEEFFFVFNRLNDRNKKIIITSDRAPARMEKFPDRLTSRFIYGVPAQLTPPEHELREAILRHKSRQRNIQLSPEILYFIAEKIKSNVRELEGALNRVISTSRLLNKPVSLELCKDALSDLLSPERESVNVETIKKQVANFYRLRVSDLSSPRRQRQIVHARQMAFYLCREMTNFSYPEIGGYFNRKHTTPLYACRQMEEKLNTDSRLQEEVDILKMLIKS